MSVSHTKWRCARLWSERIRGRVLKGTVRTRASRRSEGRLHLWLLRILRILRLLWILRLPALALLLCKYRNEFPLVVLLTSVIDLNGTLIAIGRDTDDSAARDRHAGRSADARYRAWLLAALLSRLAETGKLLLRLLAPRGS